MKKGMTILVATPGRLLDHIKNTQAMKTDLKWLVLDEADRLLDMGFDETLREIIQLLNERNKDKPRQTVLASATLSGGVRSMASLALAEPVTVNMSVSDEIKTFALPTKLFHYALVCKRRRRLTVLIGLLRHIVAKGGGQTKAVLFCLCRDEVEFFYSFFEQLGFPKAQGAEKAEPLVAEKFYELRGSMTQKERTSTFLEFSKAEHGILICTNVACRGLDMPAVTWIIQMSPPAQVEEYVHRVGRTARLGRKGRAVIFVTPKETPYVDMLRAQSLKLKDMVAQTYVDTLTRDYCDIVLASLAKHRRYQAKRLPQPVSVLMQRHLQEQVSANEELSALSRKAFLAFVRGYATYPKNFKHIFNTKALHLGKVAEGFGMTQAPRQVHAKDKQWTQEHKPRGRYAGKRSEKVVSYSRMRLDVVSEFG